MATITVTVNGFNNPNMNPVFVARGENTILWVPATGIGITGVQIGGGWPYAQPTQQGNTWSVTYNNTTPGTYPYTIAVADAPGASGSVRPTFEETPEIQNQGGGGGEPEV